LTEPLPCVEPKAPFTINLFSGEETVNWIKTQGERWMYNPREIAAAALNGHLFVNACHNATVVSYVKLGFAGVFIDDFQEMIIFPAGTAFIYDTYVRPQYRRLGVASLCIGEIARYARKKGIKRLMCHIPLWNIPAVTMHERMGFRRKYYIRHCRVLGCLKWWLCRESASGVSRILFSPRALQNRILISGGERR
jgi:GNAT superfamily N-acetyltransferase